MGCIYSKGVAANGHVLEQPNELEKRLLDTSRTDDVVADLDSVYDFQLLLRCSKENVACSQLDSKGYIKLYNDNCLSHGQESVMLRALGVSENHIKSVRFEKKPRREREEILIYLYLNWQVLQQYSSVIEALKETKFVKSGNKRSGKLYKPKDLFDPGDELLKSAFSGVVRKFPGKRFVSDGWLKILRKTGLQNANDADAISQCAKRVELLGAKSMKPLKRVKDNKEDSNLNTKAEVSLEIWSLAKTLVCGIIKNFDVLNNDNNFCNILSEIACIPAGEGFPYEDGKEGGRRVLCSYSEAILLKDWPLAWSAAPIIYGEKLVPPEHSWGALQLKSPPPFTTVLKHLEDAFHTDSSQLTYKEATFEVLQYLDRIWDTLSPTDIAVLEEIAFIPAANSRFLVNPSCLISCLTIEICPIAFELPSLYLPFVKILKEMKLQERPSISHAVSSLSNLHKYYRDQRLCPNDVPAVIEILHFLYNEITEHQNSDRSDWESLLFVPDDSCRLAHPNSCVYIDAYGSRYIKHIDTSKLRFVHQDISERLCLAFGIRKVSDVVVEELDCVDRLQTLEEIGSVSLVAIKQKLLSRSFQVALSRVFNAVSNNSTGSKKSSFQTLQRSLESISQKLQFVQCIYTRYRLLPDSLDVTRVSEESIIREWKSGSRNRALYYVDLSNIFMLIAEPPSYVSVLDLVAAVVSHILGSPVPLPIGSLFFCPQDSEAALVDVLKLSYDERRQSIEQLEHGRLPAEELMQEVEALLSSAGVGMDTEKQCLSQTTLSFQEQKMESRAPLLLEQAKLHTNSCLLNTVESSFEVLKYLDRIWATLSNSDILELKHLAFIAADNGTRLVSPSCLFVHLSKNLSPLAYKLPPHYLPFVKMLKELGSEDKLSISSAMRILLNLQRSCGYRRLNTDELHAVIEILHFLCNEKIEQQMSNRPTWESELVVPDDSCKLVQAYSSVYIDSSGSQYVKFIDSSKLRFVHHYVSEKLCSAFGIRKLSDIVVEELDCVEKLQILEEIGSVSLVNIKQKLLSRTFQVALSKILNTVSSSTPGSENSDFKTLQQSLESVSQRLQFVQIIYTRFWLLPNWLDITHVSKESVVSEWESGSCHRSLYYVDSSNTSMLIADPPSYVSVIDLVAIVVSRALGFQVPLPIASLISCPQGSEVALVNIQRLSYHEKIMNGVGCGVGFLGRELTSEDAKTGAYFTSVTPYYKGEIVAWHSKKEEKLKYGRIPEDVRPPEGRTFYRFNLETFPGKTESIISSLVYTFTRIPIGRWATSHREKLLKIQKERNTKLEHSGIPFDELVQAVEEMLSGAGAGAGAGKVKDWQQKKLVQLKRRCGAQSWQHKMLLQLKQ